MECLYHKIMVRYFVFVLVVFADFRASILSLVEITITMKFHHRPLFCKFSTCRFHQNFQGIRYFALLVPSVYPQPGLFVMTSWRHFDSKPFAYPNFLSSFPFSAILVSLYSIFFSLAELFAVLDESERLLGEIDGLTKQHQHKVSLR